MTRVVLALGSNLGDRLSHLQAGVDALCLMVGRDVHLERDGTPREPGPVVLAVSDLAAPPVVRGASVTVRGGGSGQPAPPSMPAPPLAGRRSRITSTRC